MSATKPEIDWLSDAAVVKAQYPTAHLVQRKATMEWRVWAGKILLCQGIWEKDLAWALARTNPSIVDWEAKHRPPAVDVEGELYLALLAIFPFLNKLNQFDYGKTERIAHDAIKLYEQKGKL